MSLLGIVVVFAVVEGFTGWRVSVVGLKGLCWVLLFVFAAVEEFTVLVQGLLLLKGSCLMCVTCLWCSSLALELERWANISAFGPTQPKVMEIEERKPSSSITTYGYFQAFVTRCNVCLCKYQYMCVSRCFASMFVLVGAGIGICVCVCLSGLFICVFPCVCVSLSCLSVCVQCCVCQTLYFM